MTEPTVGPVWAYGIGVILLILLAVLILALLLYCCWRKRDEMCCGSSSVKVRQSPYNKCLLLTSSISLIIYYMKPTLMFFVNYVQMER